MARALASLQDAGPMSITQDELEHLMARAREAQLELQAEALRVRQEAHTADERPGNGQLGDSTWEALSAEVRSIGPDRK